MASFSDQIPNWIQAQNAFLDANYGMQSIMSTDMAATFIQAQPPIYSSSSNLLVSILSVAFMGAMAFGTATASLV